MRPWQLKSLPQEIALVGSVFMAQFLTQGGITMSLTQMNLVVDSFAERAPQTPISPSIQVWFMGSFALTVGTFILISGRLGDVFGLKNVFLVGWAWATFWSLVCGFSVFSNSIIFFVICRAFQGIGFALLLPCGLGLLGIIYPSGGRKNLVFGLVGTAGPTGATIGSLMSAVLSQLVWWPWAYWVLGIACGVMGVIAWIAIPNQIFEPITESADEKAAAVAAVTAEGTAKTAIQRFQMALVEVDFLGSIVGVSGLVLLNFCWNQGPSTNWTAYVIALLVVAVLLIVGFFYLELNYVSNPLLHRSVFNRKIGLVLICISLGWGSFGIWQYYYYDILLNLKGYSPIMTSVCFLPFLVLGIIAAMVCSTIISKTRPSYIICLSCIAFMCGDIMLSLTPVHQTYFRMLFGQMFILAWGMDLSFPAASIILSDYLPPKHQGMAGSLVATTINYSVSLGLAIGSVVESEVMKRTDDRLYSIRQALHFGVGLAALGVVFSVVFIIVQRRSNDRGTALVAQEPLEIESSGSSDTVEK